MNSLSASKFHNESIVGFANSLWFHFFLAKSLWIHYLPRDFTMKSLSVSWIHFESTVFCKITMDCQITMDFFICYAKSLWIHYLLREFTLNPLFFRDINMNALSSSRFHKQFIMFVAISLSVSRISYGFTISFAISVWIHSLFFKFTIFFTILLGIANSLFRKFPMNSLSAS